MGIVKFKEMELGYNYETYVLLNSYVQKMAKNGSCYVEMNISDGDIETVARQFNAEIKEIERKGIEPLNIVKVCMNASLYNSSRSYNIVRVDVCDDKSIRLEDFVRTAPIDVDKEFEFLLAAVENSFILSDENVAFDSIVDLTLKLLMKYEKEFKKASAAKSIHHNVIGGLLYHTVTMVKQAEKVLENYPDLDRELLICGTALHDIGKLQEMATDGTGHTDYTRTGRLIGHSAIGVMMIEEMSKELLCDDERVDLLKHMIASHHGQLEYGAIVNPAIPEAVVLHALDMMDSKIYVFQNNYNEMEFGDLSGNIYALNNSSIYKASKLSELL